MPSFMRRGRDPIAVPVSLSVGRQGRPGNGTTQERRNSAMAKTMAKLQAQAKRTSVKKKAAAARANPKAKPKQKFNVSHFRVEDFKTDGLRSYAKYRDLGMSKATNGLLQAHVIRLLPPCDPKVVSKRHYH